MKPGKEPQNSFGTERQKGDGQYDRQQPDMIPAVSGQQPSGQLPEKQDGQKEDAYREIAEKSS